MLLPVSQQETNERMESCCELNTQSKRTRILFKSNY